MMSARTSAASQAAQELIDMHIDRKKVAKRKLLLLLGWCAINGMITEPEANLLLGRPGELTRLAKQGYFKKHDLPPGLKAAHYFPHMHYFHMTEKGHMELAGTGQELAQYGNLELHQRTYLHDHIARIEAAWRLRLCSIVSFIPEVRLSEKSLPGRKQPDGIFILPDGSKVGLEVEAADWKSGEKLAQFVTSCLNSITSGQVREILILVQTGAALSHYLNAFSAGKDYYVEWVKQNGKWWPRKISKTTIHSWLADKVHVELIQSKPIIEALVASRPIEWMSSVLVAEGDEDDILMI